MGWIGCSCSEKLRSDFVAWTFALIAPIHHVLHWVYFHNKAIPNAPKHYETHQNMSLWSYGVDRVRSFFQKFWSDFVARTLALIAPVQPILLRVSCSKEMIPNPLKHYETPQKLSLGSNGVDQGCSLRKLPTQLHGTNFCINCTSSVHFALSLLP